MSKDNGKDTETNLIQLRAKISEIYSECPKEISFFAVIFYGDKFWTTHKNMTTNDSKIVMDFVLRQDAKANKRRGG